MRRFVLLQWLGLSGRIQKKVFPESIRQNQNRANKAEMATPNQPSDQIRSFPRSAIPLTFCKEMKRKKPRHDIIEWTTAGVVSSLTVEFDSLSESFTLKEGDPSKTKLKKIYKRTSGKDKILSSIPQTSKASTFDADLALKQRFDHLIAIDTNTKVHKGNRVAIATAYYVENSLKDYDTKIPFIHLGSFLIRGLSEDEKAEPIGWFLTLKNKINYRHFKGRSLGVAVDSELGEHDLINSRTKPFYGRFLLPKEFKLIFATDAAMDSLPNQMIRFCDRGEQPNIRCF